MIKAVKIVVCYVTRLQPLTRGGGTRPTPPRVRGLSTCDISDYVNRTESVHGTLRLFPVFISPIVWNMCENLHYESVYFKELHNEQEYY